MSSNNNDLENVVFHDFTQGARQHVAAEQANESAAVTSRKRVTENIRNAFKSIIRGAAEPAFIETSEGEGFYDKKRPQYGAYNSFIGYYKDGKPNFFIRYEIDKLKQTRAFTRNAIEMRCNALGLAIYIGGISQIDSENNSVSEGVRVVTYNNLNLKPTAVQTVKTPEELVSKLYNILVTTYNQLAREYNLAGYTTDFLTLTSSSPALPNIRIDMQG